MMLTKNGPAFYDESGSESSPRFITYLDAVGLTDIVTDAEMIKPIVASLFPALTTYMSCHYCSPAANTGSQHVLLNNVKVYIV